MMLPAVAQAQDVDHRQERELRFSTETAEECDDAAADPETIVVCGQRDRSDEYRSPIPHEVDPKIRTLPGFEPPTCKNHLLSFCGGLGTAGPPR